jgi:hypothetical protein
MARQTAVVSVRKRHRLRADLAGIQAPGEDMH